MSCCVLASLGDRSGFDVVVQAAGAMKLLGLVGDRSPQLTVVSIGLPPTCTTEGLDAACVIRAESPDTGVLVLSAHVEVDHVTELLVSGRVIGYLHMSRVIDVADFVDALERIAKSASVVDPALVQEMVSAPRRDEPLAVLCARAGGGDAGGRGPGRTQVSPGGCGSQRAPSKSTSAATCETEPARNR
jgi:DNA-binding NarL/FixJ family response regulator